METTAKLQIFLRFFIRDHAIILIFLARVLFMINGDMVWYRIYDIV